MCNDPRTHDVVRTAAAAILASAREPEPPLLAELIQRRDDIRFTADVAAYLAAIAQSCANDVGQPALAFAFTIMAVAAPRMSEEELRTRKTRRRLTAGIGQCAGFIAQAHIAHYGREATLARFQRITCDLAAVG